MNFASTILSFYTLITRILYYPLQFYLKLRLKGAEEDSQRYQEKLCIYDKKSLDEFSNAKRDKEVIHIHTSSAGEFNAIKALLKKLDHPSRYLLITTVRISGALAFKQYRHTSDNIQHVYMPFDTPQAINAFLDFWSPQSLILVESEIWPNLLQFSSRKQKICIINARMSHRSFSRWSKVSFLLKEILNKCSFIAAGTKTDFKHYKNFCSNTYLTGNLKYDAAILTTNTLDLEALKKSIKERQVFACISTHAGEEEILINVYKQLKNKIPNLLMIIAPRYANRGEEIQRLCFDNQLIAILRSKDNQNTNHVPDDAQIYICNTIGELGLIFNVSKIVFVGGTLVNIGGHNVCEPINLGCTVITGKYHQNAIDIIEDMKHHNGLITVDNPDELTTVVLDLMQNPEKAESIAANGKKCIDENKGAINKTIELLEKYKVIKTH